MQRTVPVLNVLPGVDAFPPGLQGHLPGQAHSLFKTANCRKKKLTILMV